MVSVLLLDEVSVEVSEVVELDEEVSVEVELEDEVSVEVEELSVELPLELEAGKAFERVTQVT